MASSSLDAQCKLVETAEAAARADGILESGGQPQDFLVDKNDYGYPPGQQTRDTRQLSPLQLYLYCSRVVESGPITG